MQILSLFKSNVQISFLPFSTLFVMPQHYYQTCFKTKTISRHFGISGNSSWTEEGHRFSWHMKLRGKSAAVKFYAYDPIAHKKFEIETQNYLKRWQADKMSTRPYMIHQYAQHLDDIIKKSNRGTFEIRVEAYVSMNYRPHQLLIDSTVNLARQEYSDMRRNPWILPLDESTSPIPYDAGGSKEDSQNE